MLLEKMRSGVSKYVMMGLAVLLIISFAIWGVEDVARIGGDDTRDVATIGGTAVSQQDFREQYRRELNRIRERIGQIDPEQARALGIAESTLNSIISRRLLALQADDLGLLVSDQQVVAHIHTEPAFRNPLGQFDRSIYQATLANNGLSEAQYVQAVRNDLQQAYVAGAITTGLAAPAPLADAVYSFRNEKRAADVIRIPRGTLAEAPAPTDEQLREYYEKQGDAFMAPEYRSLTVLYLSPETIARDISPDPERIKEEYEYRLPSLSVPERRQVQQILLRDEESANKAYGLLSEGRTFDAVAGEVGGRTGDQIDLGLVSQSDLLPDLATPVFALDKGQFTKPIKTPLGWHILRVTDIQQGHKPSLDEVRQQIAADLAKELAIDDLVKRANRIEDAIAGGAGIEEAATEAGGRVMKVGPMDAAKKLPAGTPIDGLPADGSFVETAFSTPKGQTSRLMETSNGGYFMLRVDDVTPPAKRPLEEVRDDVVAAWKTEQLDEAAKKTADAVFEEAKGGKSLQEIAEARNLTVRSGTPVSRFASATETVIPQALLPEVFKADKGNAVMGQTVDGFAVARVTEVTTEKVDTSSGDYQRLIETVGSAFANDLLQEYTRALRQEYEVTINDAALNQFYAQQQY